VTARRVAFEDRPIALFSARVRIDPQISRLPGLRSVTLAGERRARPPQVRPLRDRVGFKPDLCQGH
jgi:hypothetical protein